MEKLKQYYKENKHEVICVACGCVLVLIACVVMFAFNGKSPTVKQELFIHEVNTELDKTPSVYMDNVKDDEAQVKFDDVNTEKLGKYKGTIVYDSEDYTINFEVKDTTAPVLSINELKFVFALDTTVEDVNKKINENIIMKDNYDNEFEPFEIITEIPAEEKELSINLTAEDSSGNKSNEITFVIQFTESGEEKDSLPTEEVKKELKTRVAEKKTEEEAPKSEEPAIDETEEPADNDTDYEEPKNNEADNSYNSGSSNNNSSNNNNGGGSNYTPAPTPEPTPNPQPSDPTQDPYYYLPDGCIEVGIFDNKTDAWNGIDNYCYANNPDLIYNQAQVTQLSTGQWHAYIFPYQ